jgi:predicted O-methyltransferase YrrM
VPRSLRQLVNGARRRLASALQPPEPGGGTTIELDFAVEMRPRWGYEHPPHPELSSLVERGRADFAERLRGVLPFVDELAQLPVTSEDPSSPTWMNSYYQGLDAAVLYATLVQQRPGTYLEVGAGNSTLFARRAIDRHHLPTRIVAIDPDPRVAVAAAVDEHLAVPLEQADLGRFEALEPTDVLFMDGSHRSFPNSDATVFFCEVLPRLPSGLLVCVDDVFLPWDYPPTWMDRAYNEQYLLASWLLAGDRLEVVLPNLWVCTQPDLHAILDPLWDRLGRDRVATNGTSIWLRVR